MSGVVHTGSLNLGDSGRFTLEAAGEDGNMYSGYVEYVITDKGMDLVHTIVSPQLRGKGIAGIVVTAAFECAKAHDLKVIPTCSYIPNFLQKNPAFQPLVAHM